MIWLTKQGEQSQVSWHTGNHNVFGFNFFPRQTNCRSAFTGGCIWPKKVVVNLRQIITSVYLLLLLSGGTALELERLYKLWITNKGGCNWTLPLQNEKRKKKKKANTSLLEARDKNVRAGSVVGVRFLQSRGSADNPSQPWCTCAHAQPCAHSA